jgi:GR25 family glycosyltransferase involved in LPS biosynthesis
MVINWATHYNLWTNIVKKKEDRILILSDNVKLIKNFNNKLQRYWNQVPSDWDMVYLGCNGSCGNSSCTDTYYKIFHLDSNEDISSNLIKPCAPLGLYGYIITYDGAKKIINNKNIKKANFNLDNSLVKYIMNNNFTPYAFIPQLVYERKRRSKIKDHNIIDPILNVNYKKRSTISELLNDQLVYIRSLNINITYYSLLLSVIALIIGYQNRFRIRSIGITILITIILFELGYSKTNDNSIIVINMVIPIDLILNLF